MYLPALFLANAICPWSDDPKISELHLLEQSSFCIPLTGAVFTFRLLKPLFFLCVCVYVSKGLPPPVLKRPSLMKGMTILEEPPETDEKKAKDAQSVMRAV